MKDYRVGYKPLSWLLAIAIFTNIHPARSQDSITGTYDLFMLNQPRSSPFARMAIIQSGTDIRALGVGQNWAGHGVINGSNGFYTWQFADGRSGRTDFVVRTDGSLQGRVVGQGVDLSYLGYRSGQDNGLPTVVNPPLQAPAQGFEAGRRLWLALEYDLRDAFAADRAGNYPEALRLYRKVASEPEAPVVFPGVVPKDDPRGGTVSSIAWAYMHDIAIARDNLARHYTEGRGVPIDLAEAARWHKLADAAEPSTVVYGSAPSHPSAAITTPPTASPPPKNLTSAVVRFRDVVNEHQSMIFKAAHPLGTLDRQSTQIQQNGVGHVVIVNDIDWHGELSGKTYHTTLRFMLSYSDIQSIDSVNIDAQDSNDPPPSFMGSEIGKNIALLYFSDRLKEKGQRFASVAVRIINSKLSAKEALAEFLKYLANS